MHSFTKESINLILILILGTPLTRPWYLLYTTTIDSHHRIKQVNSATIQEANLQH